MARDVFPNIDLKALKWVLKDAPNDTKVFIKRLLTINDDTPRAFPSREDGGLIPDPRIAGVRDASKIAKDEIDKWASEEQDEVKKGRSEKEEHIRRMIDEFKTSDFKNLILKNLENKDFDREICRKLWPVRVKGDMTIRRTRFYDLFKTKGDTAIEFAIELIGINYIRTLITTWYATTTDEEWRLTMLPLCKMNMTSWDNVTKKISNKVKSNDMEKGWHKYAEMGCLSGYRLAPWPGYDPEKDTKTLAEGGEKHDMYKSFDWWSKIALTEGLYQPTQYQSFDDFVKSGIWITQGASSMGKLEVEYEGKIYKVKCRKNMVIDAISMDELIELGYAARKQRSTAFMKNELGKIRIAVCSDLETYLKMNYIVTMSGRGYKAWKYVTRTENALQKLKRMRNMIEQCKVGKFGMAWDYQGFERQVKTLELVIIYSRIAEAAKGNVPPNEIKRWEEIETTVRDSFWNSVIVSLEGMEYEVQGGLPSGLYLTSICGDGFNLTACTAVIEVLKLLDVDQPNDDEVAIQGDDSSFLNKNVAILQLTDWMLTRMGFIGGTGKFGITSKSTEFLRVSYNETGASGYPARSIAGIVQRKPWSDTPMSDLDVINSIVDTTRICARRGLDMTNVEDKLLRIWCRKHKISYIQARTPICSGGYGIGEPIIDTRVRNGIKDKQFKGVKTMRKTDYRENRWKQTSRELGIAVSKETLTKIADEESSATVVGDEVRGLTKKVRDNWNKLVIKTRSKITHLRKIGVRNNQNIEGDIWKMGQGEEIKYEGTFGKHKELAGIKTKISTLYEGDKEKINRWWEVNKQTFWYDYRTLAKRIGNRDGENWLLGDLPADMGIWNPIASESFKKIIAKIVEIDKVPKGRLTDVWLKGRKYVLEKMEMEKGIHELLSW
jgi:hypothetical protein